MRTPISLKVFNKADAGKALKEFKERFNNTQPLVIPQDSRVILPINVQNLLNTYTYKMKEILNKALAAHPYTCTYEPHAIFFVQPHDINEILAAFTNLTIVKYSLPVSEANKNAIYWPGGGVVMAEYYCTNSGLVHNYLEHWEGWEPPFSEEIIGHFAYEVRQHLDNWCIAQQKSESSDAIDRFISAMKYMEACMPEIAASLDEFIDDEKEIRIESGIHEDLIDGDEENDMSVFEEEKPDAL